MVSLRSATIPTDDELIRWSIDNPGCRFEYVNGEMTIVSPTGGKSGLRNTALHAKLHIWAGANGYQAFGSSTGFVFGDLKVSPDEALLKAGRFAELSPEQQEQLVPLAPDVAIKIISISQQYGKDRDEVRAKCEAMARAGVGYVFMLDPYFQGEDRIVHWGTAPPNFPTNWHDVLNA